MKVPEQAAEQWQHYISRFVPEHVGNTGLGTNVSDEIAS